MTDNKVQVVLLFWLNMFFCDTVHFAKVESWSSVV